VGVWLIEKLQKFHFNQSRSFFYCFSIHKKRRTRLQDAGPHSSEYSARRIITVSTENLQFLKNTENLFRWGKKNTRRSISGKYIYIRGNSGLRQIYLY
jgi:hypothetical protein